MSVRIEPSTSPLGTLIAQLRKEQKLSMQKLAKAVGISAAYVCRLESGERHPSRDLLIKLSNILLPRGSQSEKDELMIAAGFAPNNFRNFMGRHDLLSIYERLVQEEPENFKHYIALVLNLIRTNKHEDALLRINQGMAHFDDMTQLQALMAALELSKGRFEQALMFQTEALKYLEDVTESSSVLGPGDLHLGLGVMYLMKGNQLIYQVAELRAQNETVKAQKQEIMALEDLKKAKISFESALSYLPEDVYILDELARVSINLAYLMESKQARVFWLEVVEIFERVVCSKDKHEIGYENLIESISYLAYAYLKCQDFEKAWFNINMVEACLPNYWVIHYIKADYFCLLFDQEFGPQDIVGGKALLYESLGALEKAFSVKDLENNALSQSRVDPDLNSVRQYCQQEFDSLVKKWGLK